MQDIDYDLIANERAERYKRTLYRRLASCGDREYPAALARQDIIEREQEIIRLNVFTMDKLDNERNDLEGIVDISEQEETE